MKQKPMILLGALLGIGVLLAPGCPTDPIPNGDFESGVLDPWTADGINGGFVQIVEEGTQWSANPTQNITFENPVYAANVRSSGPAPTNSVGILTSPAFTVAFPAVTFIALSETTQNRPNPVTLTYRILNATDGSVLFTSEPVATAVVNLDNAVDAPEGWSHHCIDLTRFAGLSVQIEFQQHTNVAGQGYFTLIDDVNESPAPCP
ncbi:MAG: hypothetical protein D6812_13490 [Deltaproteobacteria bacterium]|nr:MAG: hypothetical protein D6812_13490 [Deltaproteobacteria bacterium]